MVQMTYAGTWSGSGLSGAPAITDIEFAQLGSRQILVTTSGGNGALTTWEWQSGRLVPRDQNSIRSDNTLPAPGGVTLEVVDGAPLLLSYGGAGQGIASYSFDSSGALKPKGELGAGTITLDSVLWVETTNGSYVFGDSRGQDGLHMWNADPSGRLSHLEHRLVGLSGDGPDVSDMVHWA